MRSAASEPLGGFQIFKDSPLAGVTPHVLRHSFASIANDLGFTEVTIAALVGHSKGSRRANIFTRSTLLIMAADTISGYIQGLLEGIEFKQTAYALDRTRRTALNPVPDQSGGEFEDEAEEERRGCLRPLRVQWRGAMGSRSRRRARDPEQHPLERLLDDAAVEHGKRFQMVAGIVRPESAGPSDSSCRIIGGSGRPRAAS